VDGRGGGWAGGRVQAGSAGRGQRGAARRQHAQGPGRPELGRGAPVVRRQPAQRAQVVALLVKRIVEGESTRHELPRMAAGRVPRGTRVAARPGARAGACRRGKAEASAAARSSCRARAAARERRGHQQVAHARPDAHPDPWRRPPFSDPLARTD